MTAADTVMPLADTWVRHLHDTDPVNLDHQAADAEYLPPSPVATMLRAAVDAERAERAGGARRG